MYVYYGVLGAASAAVEAEQGALYHFEVVAVVEEGAAGYAACQKGGNEVASSDALRCRKLYGFGGRDRCLCHGWRGLGFFQREEQACVAIRKEAVALGERLVVEHAPSR